MRDPLQPFGFKESSYERVEQVWRCSCAEGPDARGRCQANPPCSPERSLRARRGMLTATVSLGTLAILLVSLYGKQQGSFLSPGGLSSKHANLPDGCASCHGAATDPPEAWLAAAFTSNAHDEAQAGCLSCHDFGTHTGNMFAPHGLSPERVAASKLNQGELSRADIDAWSVSCTDCHREHQGSSKDLLALATSSCQQCHKEHSSFPDKHGSGLGLLERSVRPSVVFDHDLHLERADIGTCRDCHMTPDSRGDLPISMIGGLSYESNCSSCHGAGLEAGFDPGQPAAVGKLSDAQKLTYFRLPRFNDAFADSALFPGLEAWAGDQGDRALKLTLESKVLLGAAYDDWQLLNTDKLSFSSKANAARSAAENKALHSVFASIQTGFTELANPDLAQAQASFKQRVLASTGLELSASQLAVLFPAPLHKEFIRVRPDWFQKSSEASEKGDGPTERGFFAHNLEVNYVPSPMGGKGTAHADPVIAAWAPLIARMAQMEDPSGLLGLANNLAGRCMKCHTIDQSDGEQLRIRWSPSEIDNADTSLFIHAPHLGRKDCTVCHQSTGQKVMQFNSLSVTQAASMPLPLDASLRRANFEPIELVSCAQCHAPGLLVSNDCTTCHNFHPPQITRVGLSLAKFSTAGQRASGLSLESDGADSKALQQE